MRFAQLEVGTYYVLRGDQKRVVYEKVNASCARMPDGYVFGTDGNHSNADLEPLGTLDLLAFQVKQAEDGR